MKRLNLTVSDRDYAMIEDLAIKHDCGKTDVFRKALGLVHWYESEIALNSRILIERPGGKLRELHRF